MSEAMNREAGSMPPVLQCSVCDRIQPFDNARCDKCGAFLENDKAKALLLFHMPELVTCRNCENRVERGAHQCPRCGEDLPAASMQTH